MPEIQKEEEQEKKLKYRGEIDNLKLDIDCPDSLLSIENNLNVFRFCRDPINIELDFLPNVVYDRLIGIPYNYTETNKNKSKKCARCGASFFTNVDGLIAVWETVNDQNRENLGYKSIAEGVLTSDDGQITQIRNDGHLGFYEFEGATFHKSFKIYKPLP